MRDAMDLTGFNKGFNVKNKSCQKQLNMFHHPNANSYCFVIAN